MIKLIKRLDCWLKKKTEEKEEENSTVGYGAAASTWISTSAVAANPVTYTVNTAGTTYNPYGQGAQGVIYSAGPTAVAMSQPYNYGYIVPQANNTIFTLSNPGVGEIVRLENDGKVVWANGIQIDEAAAAFARSMSIGAELQAGITKAVKERMRDTVFDEMIEIAKKDGGLTAEELTYLKQAAKIIDKLKGAKE